MTGRVGSACPRRAGTERAAALFGAVYGGAAYGVWSAPGRVNLIGEHTDHNGGLCLPMAIEHRTYAAARARDDSAVRVYSAAHPAEEPIAWNGGTDGPPPGAPGWTAYVFGVVAAVRAGVRGGLLPVAGGAAHGSARSGDRGLDIAIDSCVPEGAGLSSSAALECAVAVAVADILGADISGADTENSAVRRTLVALTRSAENNVMGVPSGPMDQSASLLAADGHALLIDCAGAERPTAPATLVPFDADALRMHALVIDTRTSHTLTDGGYAQRRRECDEAARALGAPTLSEADPADVEELGDPLLRARARHVLTENARVGSFVRDLRESASAQRLGALLDESHISLRDDFAVSTPELDLAAACAREAGAFGARMVGAGFGGSVLAFVPAGAGDPVAQKVVRQVAAAFRAAGFDAPQFFTTRPAAPACREQ